VSEAGYLAAFGAGLLFGLSDSLVRAASRRLSPYVNLLISLLVGTPILWLAVPAIGSTYMGLSALTAYIIAELLNFVAGRLLFYIAVANLGAATATVATSPVTALSASLVFATATIMVRYAAYHGGDPVTGTAVSYTVALSFAALLVIAKKQQSNLLHLSREHKYMIAAAISVALAQLSRYYSLTELSVANAVVLIGLFPLHTVAFTAIMKHSTEEKPGKRHVIAAIIAIVAIMLVTRGK